MAFRNAKLILKHTSGLSALKLLAFTAQYSRPALAPLARLFLRPFRKDGETLIQYKVGNRFMKIVIRDADENDDLHSVLEVVTRTAYPLDPAFDAQLVIDGGANIGLFSLQAAATYPRATVLMCEPLPRNTEQLQKHVALNKIDAELLPVCIGGTHGEIPFYCRHANASSFDSADPYESVMQIEVLRLGEIIGPHKAERILIKLDIEGLELETLHEFVPGENRAVIVLGELHRHRETRPDLERFFHENGWTFRMGDLAGFDALFEARSPAARALNLEERPLS